MDRLLPPAILVALLLAGAPLPAQPPTSLPSPVPTMPSPRTPAEEAIELLQQESLPLATRRETLQALANKNPDCVECWTAYGEVLEKIGDAKTALAAYERAASLPGSRFTPFLRIGLLHKRGMPEPNYPAAEKAFRRALELGAPRPRALNELGVTLALSGRTADAMKCWKDAAAEDPGWGSIYNNLIKGAINLGDWDAAAGYFEKALVADRFEENAIMVYGEGLVRRDRAGTAAAAYAKALEKYPKNIRFAYYQGVAFAEAGEKKKALAALGKARELARANPGDSFSREVDALASVEEFRLEHPSDEKRFQQARQLVFQQTDDYARLRGDLAKATRLLDDVIEEHPTFWNAYFVRGVAFRRLDEKGKARADFEKVFELQPEEPNTTMESALLLRDERAFTAAAEMAEKAIRLATRDPLFHINAGLIMIEANRCDRAWELYYATVKMVGPDNALPLRQELDIRCPRAAE